MRLPETNLHRLIDRLAESNHSFALYRMPWTDEPILVLQEGGRAEIIDGLADLNGKRGFVLVPFRQTGEHPAVLIRPDKTAYDWDAIGKALEGVTPDEACPEAGEQPTPVASETEMKQLYREAFRRFIIPLQTRVFRKLVLSRQATIDAAPDFSPLTAFVKACNAYQRMMVSLCHTPQTGTWLGSTPEIILSGQDELWHTVALAGTMRMEGETMPTDWSAKNREEQMLVAEYIRRIVRRFGSKLKEKGPYTARAGQVVHLKTDFHFLLKDTGHLGELLEELHPTPAVCGLPKQEAYDFIADNEGHDRSYYSGIIGWIDPEGDTNLYVNLRCMNATGGRLTLYAGGGILPLSTAETEWEETQAKMDTMRNIL